MRLSRPLRHELNYWRSEGACHRSGIEQPLNHLRSNLRAKNKFGLCLSLYFAALNFLPAVSCQNETKTAVEIQFVPAAFTLSSKGYAKIIRGMEIDK